MYYYTFFKIFNPIRIKKIMKNIKLLELGNKIRLERMKRGFSQEQLAELANVSIRTISDIERGLTNIRYTNLLQIASAFELTTSELLDFKL